MTALSFSSDYSVQQQDIAAIQEWCTKFTAEQKDLAFLEKNAQQVIQFFSSSELEKILKEASTVYDQHGNNFALTLAKKINYPIASKTAIEIAGKHISANREIVFKKLFGQLLNNLREHFQKVTEKALPYANESQSDQVVALLHCEVIKKSFPNQPSTTILFVGKSNTITEKISDNLSKNKHFQCVVNEQIANNSFDVLSAPHSLYPYMEEIFQNSVSLQQKEIAVEETFLFKLFGSLKQDGFFLCTLRSGPNIANYLRLLEGIERIDFQAFNHAETFLRCLDIFNHFFTKSTGKKIHAEISLMNQRQPMDLFLKQYSDQKWEEKKREQFLRLISIFTVNNEIVDLDIHLKLSVQENKGPTRSFKPINQQHRPSQQGSNELSLGQLNTDRQLQNLNGSELAMIDIKNADGVAQSGALQTILGKKVVRIVDIGGGPGDTNAVMQLFCDSNSTVKLLNIDPDEKVVYAYNQAHESVGIKDIGQLIMKVQHMTAQDVLNHFGGEKVQAVFASHSFYFENRDLFLASLDSNLPIQQHPLWKYFEVMEKNGVMVVTLQTGTGGRMIRDVLLGDHGLNSPKSDNEIELLKLFSIFGNMGTFLRYFEHFIQRYQKETGREIQWNARYSVANVSLGAFKIVKDPTTQQPEIFNPESNSEDPDWLTLKMFDFYGNWKELRESIKQTQNQEKREAALASQRVYLTILPFFAPGFVSMQHPNITLEIKIKQ